MKNKLHKTQLHKEILNLRTKNKEIIFQMFNANLTLTQIKNFIPVEYTNFASIMEFEYKIRPYPTFSPNKNRPVHNWFNYTQGFSKNLIDFCLDLTIKKPRFVFDPFSGVGTTSLSCLEHGIKSTGIDISPLAVFISNVKLDWPYDIVSIKKDLEKIKIGKKKIKNDLINKALFERSFSEENLEKILQIRESVNGLENKQNRGLFLLALISIMEKSSNIRKHGAHYRFINNDNAGVKVKHDPVNVEPAFKQKIESFLHDISLLENLPNFKKSKQNQTYVDDARTFTKIKNFDTVITSPPYLNRDNYIAQSKLELFLLNLLDSFDDYRKLTKKTLRSHVEADVKFNSNFYPDYLSSLHDRVKEMKPSYPTIPDMVVGYFQDLHMVLNQIKKNMAINTKLFFVLGNVRYAGIVIPVDTIFAHMAEDLGFNVEKILITRFKGNSPQQMTKYGKIPLRESIVILNGSK
uniref:site-specific DNA-methyltransferase (cytosine-N(4)-specific) n=1 Tax=uncultured marine crenarchaeote HF4000_APKG6D9 TaxID=455597 RepID=B3T945_9ARCH|nr:putative DNA methylase [uncultured marine crenarchaeote HF4000_APKG6D9]